MTAFAVTPQDLLNTLGFGFPATLEAVEEGGPSLEVGFEPLHIVINNLPLHVEGHEFTVPLVNHALIRGEEELQNVGLGLHVLRDAHLAVREPGFEGHVLQKQEFRGLGLDLVVFEDFVDHVQQVVVYALGTAKGAISDALD